MMLDELARGFDCEKAILAFRDAEVERIFVWTVQAGQAERLSPENLPLVRGDAFLLDHLDATVCWNQMDAQGAGFGWNRNDGRALAELPRMPAGVRNAMRLNSMLAVTFDFAASPRAAFCWAMSAAAGSRGPAVV